MLGKLFKYEFKSTARWMIPTYAFVLLMAFVNMLFINDTGIYVASGISNSIITGVLRVLPVLFMIIYILALSAMYVATVFFAASRFYTNLYSNEGYISLTLPIKAHEHILVKLITSFTWIVGTVIVSFSSFAIVTARSGAIVDFFRVLPSAFAEARMYMGSNFDLILFEGLLYAIIYGMSMILMIYAALSIGQLSNNHKVGMSILAYIGISIIMSIVKVSSFSGVIGNMFYMSDVDVIPFIKTSIMYGILWEGVLCGIYFFITRHIMTKRINLQ